MHLMDLHLIKKKKKKNLKTNLDWQKEIVLKHYISSSIVSVVISVFCFAIISQQISEYSII